MSWLAAFIEIAEHGGIHAASRAGGTAQPALSKRLSKLEEFLGYTLLTRGRAMTLTRDGERVLPVAKRILATAGELLAGEPGLDGRPLMLGVACSACADLAAGVISAAQREGATLEPQDGASPALLKHLIAGEIDAMLGRVQIAQLPEDLDGRVIAQDQLGIVCPSGHPLDRPYLHLRDVAEFPIVGFLPELSPGLELELSACWKRGNLAWNPVKRASGPDSLMAMVQAGVGVAVLPERAFIRHGTLQFRLLADAFAISRIVLTWRRSASRTRVEQLLRWTAAGTAAEVAAAKAGMPAPREAACAGRVMAGA